MTYVGEWCLPYSNTLQYYTALSHVLHCQEKLKQEEEAATALRYADISCADKALDSCFNTEAHSYLSLVMGYT